MLREAQLVVAALGALPTVSVGAPALRLLVDVAARHGVANVEKTLRPIVKRWTDSGDVVTISHV